MSRNSLGPDVFVRWWDPRLGDSSSADTARPAPTSAPLAHIPDMDDDVLDGDAVLQELYPSASSSRSDSLSSASTSGGPRTPSLPAAPLWGAGPPGKRPPQPPAPRRRPASVSSAASSSTAPRSILARGASKRARGAVTFADRPLVLSTKYEADETDMPAPPPTPTPAPVRSAVLEPRGREEKGLLQRLRSALSPSRSNSRTRAPAASTAPPPRVSTSAAPMISRPQPLRALSTPGPGPAGPDTRSLRSTRSAGSLRSAASQDERRRGGLKGLLGLFR